jgi:hypothetical protein
LKNFHKFTFIFLCCDITATLIIGESIGLIFSS